MSGHLFIVAAPSGAGKTTLVRLLLANDAQLGLSISCTTRAPRPGEEDGRDYHFVGVEDFLDQVGRGEFIEWAEVHGNYYGTLRRTIEEQLQAGRDLVLEIDWQGAQQVRKAFPQAVGIFILPPSVEALGERLRGRAKDSEATIEARLAVVRSEIDHAEEADYLIINEQLDDAVRDLIAVVRAQRLRTARQMQARGEQVRAMQSQAR